MQSARDVGGDLLDTFALDDRRLFLAVGDVSGKGMPAALFMARSTTLLRQGARNRLAPADLLESLYETLSENNPGCMFATLLVARYGQA